MSKPRNYPTIKIEMTKYERVDRLCKLTIEDEHLPQQLTIPRVLLVQISLGHSRQSRF